jgi:hypothetical protein
MANPLLNVQRSESKDAPDRPTPITPVVEFYEGDNHAYRGVETHGVPNTVEDTTIEDWDESEEKVIWVDEESTPDPIPVVIVHQGKREIKDWIVRRETCNNETKRIAGQNDRRFKMRIKNMDAAKTVYVFPDSNASTFLGWPLGPLEVLPFDAAESDVWAVSGDGTQVEVAIFEEFTK